MSKVCRLCGENDQELSSLFELKNDRLVVDLVKELIPEIKISKNDASSQQICELCSEILISAIELRAVSILNDKKSRMRMIKPSKVKVESSDDEVTLVSYLPGTTGVKKRSPNRHQIKELAVPLKRIDCVAHTSSAVAVKNARIAHQLPAMEIEEIDRRHKCDFCAITFIRLKNLERHMKSCHNHDPGSNHNREAGSYHNHEAKSFVCEYCGKVFSTRNMLYRHNQSSHPRSIECKICFAKFGKLENLTNHTKRYHTKSRSSTLACDVCQEEFDSRPALRLHKFIHRDFIEKCEDSAHRFRCTRCEFQSEAEEELHEHLATHKDDFKSKTVLQCFRCIWIFNSYDNFVQHTAQHNLKTTHICKYLKCGKKFPYGLKFLHHIKRHVAYGCDFCGQNEGTKSKIEDHIIIKHFSGVRFLCTICGESKSNSASLEAHMKAIHVKEKKFNCPFCPKTFMTATYARNHLAVHNSNLNFQCEKCPKKFSSFRNMKRHQMFHDKVKVQQKKYACDYNCGKNFYTKFAQDRHELSHSGLKPYECKFEGCDRAFSQSNDLNKHLRTHYGDLIYQCEHSGCSMAFRLKSELRIHAIEHYMK